MKYPVIISLYQRAGPSTGLPTRQEQGDLLFAINAGHGGVSKNRIFFWGY